MGIICINNLKQYGQTTRLFSAHLLIFVASVAAAYTDLCIQNTQNVKQLCKALS